MFVSLKLLKTPLRETKLSKILAKVEVNEDVVFSDIESTQFFKSPKPLVIESA